jgi:hypothetical protein
VILNSFAILALFLSIVRLVLALLVIAWGIRFCLQGCRVLSPEDRRERENQFYLLFLGGPLLLALNLVSWPVLYLLLHSYVAEWPGVMCIYGVTRIGAGSTGTSRFLPGLLQALQWAKPTLVFCSGAWFVLFLINRRTQTSPLSNRIVAILIVVGLLAAGDAVAEGAYVLIPKKEEGPSLGCCTGAFDEASQSIGLAPDAVLGVRDRPLLSAAFFVMNAGIVLGLFRAVIRAQQRPEVPRLTALFVGALATLPVSAAFLVQILAPVVLRLPYHHCPYDLIPKAPEVVLGVVFYLWGMFSLGWAWLAGWWGRCPESLPFLPSRVRTILLMGLFCYLASMVLTTMELALV